MRFSELFNENNGLFAYMETKHAELYNSLFAGTNATIWDNYSLHKFGQKTIIPTLNADNIELYLDGLFYQYGDGWVKTHDLLNENYSPIAVKTVETVAGDNENKQVSNREDADSQKAFNSTEFLPTDKHTSNDEATTTNEYQNRRETTKQPNDATRKLVAEVNMRQKYQLFTIVLDAIINQLTIYIYD